MTNATTKSRTNFHPIRTSNFNPTCTKPV
ncbi:BnaA09g14810D [Brassica napus]|uniref:BnaA09g14810D protein n=1 Tax=Brassica napus TaxID=3708 RepID=A0A078HRI4_BRANA|nr:BnaA09g14810D [Brassica napus]